MSTATKLNIQELAMRQIRVDHSLQARVRTEAEKVLDYAQVMEAKKTAGVPFPYGFPEVIVYRDGPTNWLADGFHRFEALKKIGHVSVPAEIREGTKQEAILFSVSANLDQGFRPTIEDRKKAVRMLLAVSEHRNLSDTEIGRRCGLSYPVVARVRREWHQETGVPDDKSRVLKTGDGKTIQRAHGWSGASRNTEARVKETSTSVVINFGGKAHFVCGKKDPEREAKIEQKRREILSQNPGASRVSLAKVEGALTWLAKRGVEASKPAKAKGFHSGSLNGLAPDLQVGGGVFRIESSLTRRSLPAALGDVLLWRQATDPKAAAVVVCYPDDDVKDMIRHAKALGVEFLTPHEVVERFATK